MCLRQAVNQGLPNDLGRIHAAVLVRQPLPTRMTPLPSTFGFRKDLFIHLCQQIP